MVVAEVVVKRIAIPELGFLKIALERVRRLVVKKIVGIFVFGFDGLLHFRFGAGERAARSRRGQNRRN